MPQTLQLAGRIAIGLIAAACAVLIPGEAGRLMTMPLSLRSRAGGGAASPLPAAAFHARSAA